MIIPGTMTVGAAVQIYKNVNSQNNTRNTNIFPRVMGHMHVWCPMKINSLEYIIKSSPQIHWARLALSITAPGLFKMCTRKNTRNTPKMH